MKRCLASNNDSDRLRFGLIGSTKFSNVDAKSIDLPKVYEAWNCNPCEKRFSRLACRELYAELAIVFCVKMLVNTGTPSWGQPLVCEFAFSGSQFGEE